MSQTRYYVEYVLTGATQNSLLRVEDNLYIKKLIGVGSSADNAIGVKIIPQTDLDVGGQIRVNTGSTNLEGEIRYKDKYLWINTGGTSTSWVPLGTGGGLSAATDSNFFYDDTTDTLYTLYLNLSGATGATAHATNYYGLFIDRDTGLVYSNTAGGGTETWISISSSLYTATPNCSSGITITGTLPSDVVNGVPIRWLSGSTYYYNQVLTYNSGAGRLWLRGAPLGTGECINALYYSNDRDMIHVETFMIPGNYADTATSSLLRDDMLLGSPASPGFYWMNRSSSLVGISVIHGTDDTGLTTRQPALTPYMSAGDLLSNPLTASTSMRHTNVIVNRYRVSFGDRIDIRVYPAVGGGVNNDANDISVYLIFVMDS